VSIYESPPSALSMKHRFIHRTWSKSVTVLATHWKPFATGLASGAPAIADQIHRRRTYPLTTATRCYMK